VFAETGFVVTPFLPGDSLLFAAGTLPALNPALLIALLAAAAILGDTANYAAGHFIGPKVFKKQKSLFFNPAHLERAHRFYEKYGGKTIILARFIPIIRTFAPFVAGVGKMEYRRFVVYNATGGAAWVLICVFSGYFFGGFEFIQQNFELVIVAIVLISVMPMVVEFVLARRRRARGEAELGDESRHELAANGTAAKLDTAVKAPAGESR